MTQPARSGANVLDDNTAEELALALTPVAPQSPRRLTLRDRVLSRVRGERARAASAFSPLSGMTLAGKPWRRASR
jgi:hypothetical protein